MNENITIGQIINTHGLKGELKVYGLTDDIKRFKKLKFVFIENTKRNVTWCKLINKNIVVLKIEGIDSIEEANKFKDKYLEVLREDAVKLPENSYFVNDLIGSLVVDINGHEYGKIGDVIFTGANDVYWIKEGKELLIPAIKDIVLNVDVAGKTVTIKPAKDWNYED